MRPTFSNEHGGTFVLIEPGEIKDISISEPYFIGARPVTQVEWVAVMDNNPSKFQEGWSAGLKPGGTGTPTAAKNALASAAGPIYATAPSCISSS